MSHLVEHKKPIETPTPQRPAQSRPYLALGLTFLLLGIGFACPWPLVPGFPQGMWEGQISREVLNLYALTVFLGWAHFFYAWVGQWRGSGKMPSIRRGLYWLAVLLVLTALAVTRSWIGIGAFSLAVWVYNIAHFIKAENFFAGTLRSRSYQFPALAFAWFTLALFQAGPLRSIPVAIGGAAVLTAIFLVAGDWKALASDESRVPLITLFFLGETLVWCTYGKYMSPAFRVGVYVFHIAAASFFHYLSSYFYANSRVKPQPLLTAGGIVLVNLLFLLAGCAVNNVHQLGWASVIFAPEWFTLWVALHLAASDLLPWWKRAASTGTDGTVRCASR